MRVSEVTFVLCESGKVASGVLHVVSSIAIVVNSLWISSVFFVAERRFSQLGRLRSRNSIRECKIENANVSRPCSV